MRDTSLPSPGKINRSHALRKLAAKAISYGEIVKARSPDSDVLTTLNAFFTACAAQLAPNPTALFRAGEKGWWYDPSDMTTLFQDSAGTVPVTEVGQPVGRMLDKSGNGNHIIMATAGSRPVLAEALGFYYLDFDGVDDSMRSAVVCPTGGATKATLFNAYLLDAALTFGVASIGISDPAAGISASPSAGTFANSVFSGTTFEVSLNGASGAWARYADFVSGTRYVTTTQLDITVGADLATSLKVRRNGVLQVTAATSGTVPGAGAFSEQLINLGNAQGAGGGVGFQLNGRIYASICRFAETSDTDVAYIESWINARTGAF